MNALINISHSNGNRAVSARELHEFLIKDAKGGQIGEQFNHWIERKLEYGYELNIDYTIAEYDYLGNEINSQSNNQDVRVHKRDYILTVDTAKEMAMTQNNDKGKQARRYFIAIEKQARNPQLSVSSKTLIETRRQQRDELMLLIRNNFMQGDIKKVALDNNWSYETVRNVVKRRHFNAAIAQALFNQAMANKQNENNELQGMIEQLKLNF